MANEILDQQILHKGDNDAIPFWKIATWKNYVVLATGLTLVLLVQKALSSYLVDQVSKNEITAGTAITRIYISAFILYTSLYLAVGTSWALNLVKRFRLSPVNLFAGSLLPAVSLNLAIFLLQCLNFKVHVSRDLLGKIILDNLMGAITFALIVSAVYLFKAEYERWKSVLIFLFAGILSCIHLAFVL